MQPQQPMMQEPAYTEQDLEAVYQQAMRQQQNIQTESAFAPVNDENLIKWQLELDNILERIDHLLRGHKLTFKNGNMLWTNPSNIDEVIFNDYGVNEILRILSMYLNRNTILSNYTEEQVELKVFDFGNEMADLIEAKYEDMGLNTHKKMVIYPMILREVIDVVHSSYLRALKGGERQSLREARTVSQSQPLYGNIPMGMPMMQNKERGVLNPMRYIKGRYA